MPDSFEIERRDELALLWLDRPPVNALDREVLDELAEVFGELERSDARAVVFAARGKVFSAGADLLQVLERDRDYIESSVHALSRAFGALFEFPRPVVAAVNGHAIAGGAVITCGCDYRVMADRGTIGLSELRVGVPFPLYALEIVRFAVAPQHFQEIIYRAQTYVPSDALDRGLVDEVVEPGAELDRAIQIARELARVPTETFELMKRAVRAPTVERVRAGSGPHDPVAAGLWASDEVRVAIKSFLEATIGRKS